MKADLDRDSPVVDEVSVQHRREAYEKVEQLLYTAAQYAVGPHLEAIVEAEVIGACAVAPISPVDTIDVLCKVSQISGQEFFASFKQMLFADPQVSCARQHPEVVTGSQLSGLCFSYAKVRFRMFLARVPWCEDDEETFQSLNGCLLSRALNEIVSGSNSFALALRMVKFWAKRRGIYGKACGYPGGLTWSICLARVHQMHPNANAAELVVKFFHSYYCWDWRTVVALLPTDSVETDQHGPVEDGKIAVMTPGSRPINTAAHVKKSALPVLQEELRRAYKLSKKMAKGQASWSDLYALPSVASKSKHYIRVEFLASSKEALDLLVEWGEACLPTLLTDFEQNFPNVQIRPWSQHVMAQHEVYAFSCNIFIGLRFPRPEAGVQQQIDLRVPVSNFLELLDRWPHKEYFAGQYDTMMQHLKRHELAQWWEACAGDSSLQKMQLSDSQSEEGVDSNSSQAQSSQSSLPRWSDGIDEHTGIIVECY